MSRIDATHAPYKRKSTIGPGPKRRPKVHMTGQWVCTKPKKNPKGLYVQICKNTETGSVHTVRRKKGAKKRYNKLYRKWAATHRTTLAKKPARRGYTCRRTRVSPCK